MVFLSSAEDDRANIDVKAAMLALEQPQTVTYKGGFNVKERFGNGVRVASSRIPFFSFVLYVFGRHIFSSVRAYPKALLRTVALLKQNPCKVSAT